MRYTKKCGTTVMEFCIFISELEDELVQPFDRGGECYDTASTLDLYHVSSIYPLNIYKR